ncbi:MAG: hypothetical protein MZU91_06485 [Desulfosudis oleivorans]|nr:hypothetical protein [Desulfosudis oleivorans]
MGWFILKHIFSTLLAIVNVRRLSDQEKDLEILVLRQQLSILQRKLNHPIKPSKIEKLTLAVLTAKFKQTTRQTANQLRDVIRIFEPETVLRWHREVEPYSVEMSWVASSTITIVPPLSLLFLLLEFPCSLPLHKKPSFGFSASHCQSEHSFSVEFP